MQISACDERALAMTKELALPIRPAHPTTAFDHQEQLSETRLMGADLAACIQVEAVDVCLALSAR